MTKSIDSELLVQSRSDPAAFGEFYRRNIDRVIGFVARRVEIPADVADVVASTFLAALEARGRFDPSRGDAVPWLYGIAHRVVANRRREQGRKFTAIERIKGERLLETYDIERLEDRIDAERATPVLQQALQNLTHHHRTALLLVGADDLSPSDAARVLGITPAAFRVRLVRARRALRRAMADAEGAQDVSFTQASSNTPEVQP